MAHTKSSGSVKANKDSISKRRGVKVYGGQAVIPGNIIVRQKGTKFFPGLGVSMGNDFTIYSLISGTVHFKKKLGKKVIEVINL